MDHPEPELSLVIPVFNERDRVRDGLGAVVRYVRGLPWPTEVLVVDDGSTDETVSLAGEALGDCGRVLAEPHRGKGGAVRAGMLAARGRYRIFFDVDLATPLESIGPCLDRLRDGADIVIGSRRTAEARIEQHQGAVREWLGRGYSLLSRLATGVAVSDFTCGFKGFTAAAAQSVFRKQRVMNWAFDTEVLFIATRLGCRIHELPVRWRDDHRTKVRLGRDVLGSLRGLALIRFNHLLGRYRDTP